MSVFAKITLGFWLRCFGAIALIILLRILFNTYVLPYTLTYYINPADPKSSLNLMAEIFSVIRAAVVIVFLVSIHFFIKSSILKNKSGLLEAIKEIEK